MTLLIAGVTALICLTIAVVFAEWGAAQLKRRLYPPAGKDQLIEVGEEVEE